MPARGCRWKEGNRMKWPPDGRSAVQGRLSVSSRRSWQGYPTYGIGTKIRQPHIILILIARSVTGIVVLSAATNRRRYVLVLERGGGGRCGVISRSERVISDGSQNVWLAPARASHAQRSLPSHDFISCLAQTYFPTYVQRHVSRAC
jgi:hypothetical protein